MDQVGLSSVDYCAVSGEVLLLRCALSVTDIYIPITRQITLMVLDIFVPKT